MTSWYENAHGFPHKNSVLWSFFPGQALVHAVKLPVICASLTLIWLFVQQFCLAHSNECHDVILSSCYTLAVHLYNQWYPGHTYLSTAYIISISGLILGLRPANERRRYFGTSSLIGWVCNDVSHWLGANPESDLNIIKLIIMISLNFVRHN